MFVGGVPNDSVVVKEAWEGEVENTEGVGLLNVWEASERWRA